MIIIKDQEKIPGDVYSSIKHFGEIVFPDRFFIV